jgi:hypothetical protein
MGRASIDLPDPLDQATRSPAALTKNADDLLSQLAGDEIERMLAEAGVERLGGADDARVSDLTSMARDAERAGGDVHQINAVGDEALQATAEVSRQLSELFAQLNRPVEMLEEDPEPQPAPAEEDHWAGEELVVSGEELEKVLAAAPEPGVVDAAAGRHWAERDGGELQDHPVAGEPEAADLLDVEALDEPQAGWLASLAELCLRPLVWLNAPVASSPPVLRDALGKVAIITLVNAAAVLVYVIVFRRGE